MAAIEHSEDPERREGLARLRGVHLEMVDAVLGGESLSRVAEIAARAGGGSVAILVRRLGVACVSPPEAATLDIAALERWLTERIDGRPAQPPRGVLFEAPITSGGDLLGLVVLSRIPGRDPAPDAAECLHLAAVASMTEVAVAEAREEVAQNLRGSFIDDVRSREDLDPDDVRRRAARLGCPLEHGFVVCCARLVTPRPSHLIATIAGDWPGALAQHEAEADGLRVCALLPAGAPDHQEATLEAARRLAARLGRLGTVGLSSFYSEVEEVGRAIQEAELVLEVLRISDAPIAEELGSGTYRLLFRVLASHPAEVRALYEDTIAPIARYDDQYRTELLATLEAYLRHNCNMNATATAIFAHRHTVAYRLERVHELSGLDPLVGEDRERLGLGLKAYRVILPRLPR